MNPKYPIYVISKGRWESRLTSKALEKMKVPYKIVIESQEYDNYVRVIDKSKILVLPFSNLGQGSIPVRNWVWEHSMKAGHKRHWVVDDNISSFMRLNKNTKIRVYTGTFFRCIEDFVDRYENVAIAGPHYQWFISQRERKDPYLLNSRVYSCILIDNSLNFRWRGKYNEDTDISLRVLKAGYCTMLFHIFLQDKITTMIMKGGNTEEIYGGEDKRLKFAQSLQKQHPDVVKIVQRYGRWHHEVDYTPFEKNKLIKKKDLIIKKGINNYGMELVKLK